MESTEPGTTKELTSYILNKGLDGVRPLSSATYLAEQYLIDQSYSSNEQRVKALINWETSKNFTTGFITGLGGVITMPISIPSAVGASWILQARMSGAIARIYGHDLTDDRVRTFILLSLAGDSTNELLKAGGIEVGKKLTQRAIAQIPGRMLIELNKAIGARLATKACDRGFVNLTKSVPLTGGLIGGLFDATTCRIAGRTAQKLFKTPETGNPNPEPLFLFP